MSKSGCKVGYSKVKGRCVKLPNVRVRNMESNRGNKIANQFEISTDKGTYFQSYNSVIVFRGGGKVYLDKDYWDYSTTTGKYRNIFLMETKRETLQKIKDGTYILTDLNK